MNVINEAGILALATRLQRLNDRLRKDGALIYSACGIDFETKWFPVIYTLHLKPCLSVVELASEIGYAHPSTITLLKELEKLKIVRSTKDKADERKRLLQLTQKGKDMVEQMKPVWQLMIAAATDLTNTPTNLMAAISEVEQQMDVQGFYQRAKALMNEKPG